MRRDEQNKGDERQIGMKRNDWKRKKEIKETKGERKMRGR